MSNSPEVAMTVIEPGGRRWAQLLNVDWAINDLLPLITSRLDLPDRINYELLHVRSGHVLGKGDSLHSLGIAAGEELQLRPVRDELFPNLMDALYGQAVDYAAMELWGQVESRLETIYRLDPNYPDPRNVLGTMAAAGRPAIVPGGTGGAPAASIPTTYTAGPYVTAERPGAIGSGSPLGSEPMNAAPRPQPAAKPGRSSCGVVALILGVLVLLGLIAAAAVFAFFLLAPANGTSDILPFGNDEPELGTGDVQVTLRWDTSADLDLRVTDPAGAEIYFASQSSASGGQLDVDANATCEGDAPVENIFWPTGSAPTGTYSVSVDFYGACDSTEPANYVVTILVNGQEVNSVSGTIADGDETVFIGEFSR